MEFDVQTLTDEELADLIQAIQDEQVRRQNIALYDQRLGDTQQEFRDIKAFPLPPQEWAKPVDTTQAYKAGDVVSCNGTAYRSRVNVNVWEPTDPEKWAAIGEE
jgi:hypothetical protein